MSGGKDVFGDDFLNSGKAKAGRRKKKRAVTTTEKPAKLVMRMEIKAANRAGFFLKK